MLADAGGKTMLLTGDARGDKILEGLESIGAVDAGRHAARRRAQGAAPRQLEQRRTGLLRAHHRRSLRVLGQWRARQSRARNAEDAASTHAATEPFELHLTYPIDEIDVERKKDWEKEQAKEKKKKENGTSSKEPREDWSPSKHSLKAFFDAHPLSAGQKLHIVQKDQAHVIDLLDTVGF